MKTQQTKLRMILMEGQWHRHTSEICLEMNPREFSESLVNRLDEPLYLVDACDALSSVKVCSCIN